MANIIFNVITAIEALEVFLTNIDFPNTENNINTFDYTAELSLAQDEIATVLYEELGSNDLTFTPINQQTDKTAVQISGGQNNTSYTIQVTITAINGAVGTTTASIAFYAI